MEWTLLGKNLGTRDNIGNKRNDWKNQKDDTKQSKVNPCANRMSETKRIGSFEKGSESGGHTGFV
jgi:hypothetical protein